MSYYIGADLGTSSLKLMLTDASGNIIKTVKREYDVSYPEPGWSEQRPEDWWEAFTDGMRELAEGYADGIEGIGVAGQMHGLVVLDEFDNVIRPAILWNDGRTAKQTDMLNNAVGREKLSEMCANIAFAGFTAPKLLWMAENEPECFARIRKIMLPKDYINYMLTGVHATDMSDASGMLLLDVKNRCWSDEMLKICGVDASLMPKLYESSDIIGEVKDEIAKLTGIGKGVKVAAGAGDNAAAAIGTGTVGNGSCNISLGTSGTVFVSADKFALDSNNALHSFCHADGAYHLMGCILSAASCVGWLCEKILLTKDIASEEARVNADKLGSGNIYFLPYLMGERSPINDTYASGTFIGMRPDTTREDMYLAVLEGVAFAICENLNIVKSLGIDVKRSFVCGGGAASELWLRILACVLDTELDVPQVQEGPGMGGAMLAMIGTGRYKNAADCCAAIVKVQRTVKPEAELVKRYNEKYSKFKKIYPCLKPLYKELV